MDRRRDPLPTRVEGTPPLPAAFDDVLRRGLADLDVQLDDRARAAIDGHVRLLLAWTRAINLTGIRDPAAVALEHVVDSLTAAPWLAVRPAGRLLDLGSGGGFPGVPLGIVLPSVDVTLLEPIGKKARFLSVMTEAIGLADRIQVRAVRAEELGRDAAERTRWDVVTARAVASTADLVELAAPLLAPGGALLAWKRGDLRDELAAGRRAIEAVGGGRLEVLDVDVDGLRDHRLVVVTREGEQPVPAGFPRDPAARRRRPW